MKNIKCRNCFFYRNEWCKKIVDSPDPEEARDCNYFRDMTKADRIRAMSDEELVNVVPCPLGFSMFRCPIERQCGPCKREWLKQPAEEDDHA